MHSLVQELLYSHEEYIIGTRLIFEVRLYQVKKVEKLPVTILGSEDQTMWDLRSFFLRFFAM